MENTKVDRRYEKVETTQDDFRMIVSIAHRAVALLESAGVKTKAYIHIMDLEYCHAHHKLNLQGMLSADDGNLMHDVMGINQNLNRETHLLDNGFSPRFTQQAVCATCDAYPQTCPDCGNQRQYHGEQPAPINYGATWQRVI